MTKRYLNVSFTVEKPYNDYPDYQVSPNVIASNLAAKPDELANLHRGMLTNHTGNKQLLFKEREGDNVSSNAADT